MDGGPYTDTMIEFVARVGIEVRCQPLEQETFLPGLDIQNGALLIDREKLAYPGDILHEAGHIAVADAERRKAPELKPTKGEEMAAIAWSYAALRHLTLPPEVVFHDQGYQKGSAWLIEAYDQGTGPGLPMLIWFGVTACPNGNQPGDGTQPFPKMDRWLR